jgi:hypothetical protein
MFCGVALPNLSAVAGSVSVCSAMLLGVLVGVAERAKVFMADEYGLPCRGAVFWPVGTGDSTTVIVDDEVVLQVVVDRLKQSYPAVPEDTVTTVVHHDHARFDGRPHS